MFSSDATGDLVPIAGTDAPYGPWDLSPSTYLEIAHARAAVATLDSTACAPAVLEVLLERS